MSTELELRQLQEAIVALREELEKVKFEEREHIQQAVAGTNEEIRQLRGSIVELRDQIELREAQHQEMLRAVELQNDREKADLHQTISLLRQKLEELSDRLKTVVSGVGSPSA